MVTNVLGGVFRRLWILSLWSDILFVISGKYDFFLEFLGGAPVVSIKKTRVFFKVKLGNLCIKMSLIKVEA